MIGRCSGCKKIKWIFKNKHDGGYNQKACWKCYCNSIEEAKKFHAENKHIKEDFQEVISK